MFAKVSEPDFVRGEHDVLRFWDREHIFDRLREKNASSPKQWSFLDGPITANNPMGVHHAWGRTYKDVFQRFFAMTGHRQRYQNGFDCQGLWVEVEVEKELKLGTKRAILDFGIDRFVNECKKRVLRFAARQTEQSIRLGYWMEWDLPDELRKLAEAVGSDATVTLETPRGHRVTGKAHQLVGRLGNPEWGGSYFTFSTENNETIWTFLKKCHTRGKVYRGHDVMPWSGRAGSAYSQMEVADGRKLTTHKSCFVRLPLVGKEKEYLLVWTTTPWTLTSNVAAAVNPDLEYVKLRAKRDGSLYFFAKDNLEYKRLDKEFKEGFGRPEWQWPNGVGKLKTLSQIFKEQGGYEDEGTVVGADMVGWKYSGPFDDISAQNQPGGFPQSPPPRWGYKASIVRAMEGLIRIWYGGAPDHSVQAHAADLVRDAAKATESQIEHRAEEWLSQSSSDEEREFREDQLAGDFLELKDAYDFGTYAVYHAACVKFIAFIKRLFQAAKDDGLIEFATLDFSSLTACEAMFRRLDLPVVNDVHWKELVAAEIICKEMLTVHFHSVEEIAAAWKVLDSWETVDGDSEVLGPRFASELGSRQSSFLYSLADQLAGLATKTAAECHRVIDGGRDFKGSPNVVAGEGTGIVHIAPGCGDIDHQIGQQLGLVEIAPLGEDGTFLEGFGDFTGRNSVDPATAQLVFDKLREKQLLVYVEDYPHIYPHCWRTGDELVFRLVDEWFIDMDWRDEIKAVVNEATWLPDSIDGKTREVEWLTNMRDWMVSKKRFWGLALPIWVNPDDPTDFDVMGSLDELKVRALDGGEGWDDFSGQTPHRPWIDNVKIKSTKTGALLSRIPDVGNPWLDAGIVPFSTMQYNTNKSEWEKWYPPDFVTECFPGQFRNWFYSLLALSTMMRYDETDDPAAKRPFKTLLGHRLVMNEAGEPMSKSKGTAIWFEEAAEQLGVDTLRWMYLAQNPAVDLKFGLRHKDEPVTLDTVDGPISETREGMATCRVTSKPADEVRRQVLIPLWNSYAFFVNYARLDGFDPSLPQAPLSDRPEIDRWILSNLQALIASTRRAYEAFDTPEACRAAAAFIDDLSNWYIRRNRRRFWRSRNQEGERGRGGEGEAKGAWDSDKLAAYQTLYHVLVTLTKVLAPAIPFMTERMYQNLVGGEGSANPQAASVHLCDYPDVDRALLDESLNKRTAAAQLLVTLGHRLREASGHRVRQPLAELRFASTSPEQRHAIETLADVVADELNVKRVTACDNLDDLVHYVYKPNLKTLGPKFGKLLNVIKTKLPTIDPHALAPLRRGESVTVSLDGNEITLAPDDVMVSTEQASDWVAADDQGLQIALSTTLTPELAREGMARDFVRHVQQARKDANLEIEDHIRIAYRTDNAEVTQAIHEWTSYIEAETLADSIEGSAVPADARTVPVGEASVALHIARV